VFPKSLRWRLPLSYAAIASFAALAAGVVLMTTLRSHYVQREQNYVARQAFAVSRALDFVLSRGTVPLEEIQQNFPALALFTQARVQLFDAEGSLIADSGLPNEQRIDFIFRTFTYNPMADQVLIEGGSEPVEIQPIFGIEAAPPIAAIPEGMWAQRLERDVTMPVGSFGFGVDDEMTLDGIRSDQQAEAFLNTANDSETYSVLVSEGPAYGLTILTSVFLGWVFASTLAIVLAAGAGWLISRRITAPLLTLTDVTGRMAKGDLSARANVWGQDEVGSLARSFNEMANRVEETIFTLRRFVADAAHEIHTPLTALNTNLELATSEGDDTARLTFLEQAQQQLKRLEMLTTNLLNLSRLETGSTRDEPSRVDLTALVRQTSELYASQAEQKGILFTFDLPAEKIVVNASETQLRHALENMLENAIKFTPETGTVTVGICQSEAQTKLWVKDTGIGIPPEDLPLVFSRFHRGRNAAAYPGSGLGLAILKAIAERHHGQVQVESQLGQGTYFAMQLPV
jgi:signal transduction histidine kinase